jgi:MFS family permease
MRSAGYEMGQVAFIMQWHVLGMFAPSFFTGGLIARFGVERILLAGAALLVAAAGVATQGQTLAYFWTALVLLGVGWNFLFIGGSALLTRLHSERERGKVQGVNDLIIFSLVALGSLMSGQLLHYLGWELLNLAMLAPVLLVVMTVFWWKGRVTATAGNQEST